MKKEYGMQVRTSLLAIAAGLVSATAGSAATLGVNATAYSLGNEGTTLVTVASVSGATKAVDLTFDTGSNVSLDAIEYRPQTRQFYGYDNNGDTVYEINRTTGAATAVVRKAGITNDNDLDIDFNPVVDAMRIVTGQNENVVFAPNATPPTLTAFTKLSYVADDPNFGRDPNVVFNAYINAVPNATMTEQYVIDTDFDLLATLGNNTGALKTAGRLMFDNMAFDATEDGGFDILSFFQGDNDAYALLTNPAGYQAIYRVPLDADAFGNINLSFVTDVTTDFGPLDGLTVVPSQVPIPAAGLLLFGGLGSLAMIRRRRRGA